MGCFYTGFDYKNRVNGYFKIGETDKKTPAARLNKIRKTDSFQCLGWLAIKDESHAERLYVESYVRLMMSNHPDLTHTQNDHFLYTIKKGYKYEQAQEYANLALKYAMEACEEIGLDYELGTKTYKRS